MKWMNDNKASILEGGAPLGKRSALMLQVFQYNTNFGATLCASRRAAIVSKCLLTWFSCA